MDAYVQQDDAGRIDESHGIASVPFQQYAGETVCCDYLTRIREVGNMALSFVDVRFYKARGPMPGGEPGWKRVTVFCRSDNGLLACRGILINAERGTVVMEDGTPFPDSRQPAFYAELPE